MKEFFRGWKRKVGCLTLTMACVAMVGWVRSFIVADFVHLPFKSEPGTNIVSAISTNSGVVDLCWFSKPIELPGPTVAIPTPTQPIEETFSLSTADELFKDRSTGAFTEETDDRLPKMVVPIVTRPMSQLVPTLRIAYWSIVIPLTLISAWLLLKKPTKPNQTKTAQPISNEGGGAAT